MSTSKKNEQAPVKVQDVGGTLHEHVDPHAEDISKVTENPEGFSMQLGNRSVQEASDHLINTTLNALPVHPNHISNVKGPSLEVTRVNNDAFDVKVVHRFRAHFGYNQRSSGVADVRGDWSPEDISRVNTQPVEDRNLEKRANTSIVPGGGSTVERNGHADAPDYEGSSGAVISVAGDASLPTTIQRNPWVLDPRKITVGHRIAVGGFAEVFVGKYEGTVVAIKRLIDGDLSAIAKFEQEVSLLARLRHPNLILFMGYCMSPQLCILSEYMQKGCLMGILRQRQGVELDQRFQRIVAISIARGMAYLHSRNPPILHLDLKSPNILVDNSWRVKITDFGLSQMRFRTLVSHAGMGAGSPHWMAPECLRSEHVDEKADVYSFGVVLWELITGKMPWEDLNPMQVVGAVGFRGKALPIPDAGDPVLIELFTKCCQADSKARPSFPDILEILGVGYAKEGKQEESLLSDFKRKRLQDTSHSILDPPLNGEQGAPKRMLEQGTVLSTINEISNSNLHQREEKSLEILAPVQPKPSDGTNVNSGNDGLKGNNGDENECPEADQNCYPRKGIDADTCPGPPEPGPKTQSQGAAATSAIISPFAALASIPLFDKEEPSYHCTTGSDQKSSENDQNLTMQGLSDAPPSVSMFSTVPSQSCMQEPSSSHMEPVLGRTSQLVLSSMISETVNGSIVPEHMEGSQDQENKKVLTLSAEELRAVSGELCPTSNRLVMSSFPGFAPFPVACQDSPSSPVRTNSPEMIMEPGGSGEWKIKVADLELDEHTSSPAQDDLLEDKTGVVMWSPDSLQDIPLGHGLHLEEEAGPSKTGGRSPSLSSSSSLTPALDNLESGNEGQVAQARKGGYTIPPIVFTQDPSKAVLAGVFGSSSSRLSQKPRGFWISRFDGSSEPPRAPHSAVAAPLSDQLSKSDSESEED